MGDNIGNILIDSKRKTSDSWSKNMFITEKSKAVDKQNDQTYEISGYVDSKLETFKVNTRVYESNFSDNGSPIKETVDSLMTGDIIKYRLNQDNEIVSVKLIFSNKGKQKNEAGVSNTLYSENGINNCYYGMNDMTYQNFLGKIEDIEDGYIKLRLFDDNIEYIPLSSVSIIKYDYSDNSYEKNLTSASVETGDVVVIGMNSMNVNQVIVYKNSGL